MKGPDRIWAKTHGASTDVLSGQRGLIGGWNEHRRDGQDEYLRRDGETMTEVRAALKMARARTTDSAVATVIDAALAKMGE